MAKFVNMLEVLSFFLKVKIYNYKGFMNLVYMTIICLSLFACVYKPADKENLIGQDLNTEKISQIRFSQVEYDFGKIHVGDTATHFFVFKNIGLENLIIKDVSSSCGCTIPIWPKYSIKSGSIDSIKVNFVKEQDLGLHKRDIIVKSNTNPAYKVISIQAVVIP